MKEILTLDRVSVSYNNTPALKDISFSIYEGEIFGFLGPSGAGKTSTIKTLTKQLIPSHGEITLFGHDLKTLNTSVYENIGIMSDTNDIYDNLSVYENLKFFAEIKGVDVSEVDRLLEKIGLLEDKKKLAKKLSRGMRQRLILATAIIHKPKLLFLDEPTAALDPKTTADIHDLFRSLNREGTTIFLTTHSMDEADKLCHRIAFIDQGEIVEMGSKEALKMKYALNEINVRYENKGVVTYTKSSESLVEISEASKTDTVLTIHSNEPTLETIFLTVTGRENYELA